MRELGTEIRLHNDLCFWSVTRTYLDLKRIRLWLDHAPLQLINCPVDSPNTLLVKRV